MKKNGSILIVLLLMLGFSACSPKLTFSNSTIAPAATGEVTFKKDKNQNFSITVNVRNLAEPERLTPAKKTYLVWMDTNEKPTQKLGQLSVHSKLLKGTLKATSLSEPSMVYITAEDDAAAALPGGMTVMTTQK